MKRCLLSLYVAGTALLQAGTAVADELRNCADTFQTQEFQTLDFRVPYEGNYLLNLIKSLKGQVCTVDQLEAFFNARHAFTQYRYPNRISFNATLNTSGFFFKNIVGIGASVEGGRIASVFVATEVP